MNGGKAKEKRRAIKAAYCSFEKKPDRHADVPSIEEIRERKKAGAPILKPPNRAERRAVKFKRGPKKGGTELDRAALSSYAARFRELFGVRKTSEGEQCV